jgi:hypothetical protein
VKTDDFALLHGKQELTQNTVQNDAEETEENCDGVCDPGLGDLDD